MSKKKKPLRPLGHVLLDLEKIIMEMCVGHDLQWGDVLHIVWGYLRVHLPGYQEFYNAGGSPVFEYGPAKEEPKKKEEI